MTSPAHPSPHFSPASAPTLPSFSLSLSFSLSPVNCASILIRPLPSFYPNSLTPSSLSLTFSLFSAISSSLLFSLPPFLSYLHTLTQLQLSFSPFGHRSCVPLPPLIATSLHPSIPVASLLSFPSCCLLQNPSFAFCLLPLLLLFLFLLPFLPLSRCCRLFIIVGAPSSCISST